MNNNIKEGLEKEMLACIERISKEEPGSEARDHAIKDLDRLSKICFDVDELRMKDQELTLKNKEVMLKDRELTLRDSELTHTIAIDSADLGVKLDQIKESKKDRWCKVIVDVLGVVLPIGFSTLWMLKGFKFEETGTITSNTFKWLINRLRFTK